jgi:hypothetical protein
MLETIAAVLVADTLFEIAYPYARNFQYRVKVRMQNAKELKTINAGRTAEGLESFNSLADFDAWQMEEFQKEWNAKIAAYEQLLAEEAEAEKAAAAKKRRSAAAKKAAATKKAASAVPAKKTASATRTRK